MPEFIAKMSVMEATAPPPKSTAELPITSIPPGQEPFKTSIEYRFQVWQEYEKIVMHFNDLLIRLRTQALGGVAAVAVLAAVIVRGDISPTLRWEVLVGAFAMLLLFWSAVYWLDTLYYNRLLEGAVDAIMDIEDSDKNNAPFPGLQMSTRIENVVSTGKPTPRLSARAPGAAHFLLDCFWGAFHWPRHFVLRAQKHCIDISCRGDCHRRTNWETSERRQG
jgi:hypothetical protein